MRRWYPDVWDFPGGHVEPGESLRTAHRREVFEEVGVTVAALQLADAPAFRLSEGDLDLAVWKVSQYDGGPINAAPIEHDQVRWFPIEEAVESRPAHAAYPALLRALAQ